MQTTELIAAERYDQIIRHKFDTLHDLKHNQHGELQDAAMYLITGDESWWPQSWCLSWKERFDKKPRTEQLIIAASFLAAEVDRIDAITKTQTKK